jgi:hypothetical protein
VDVDTGHHKSIINKESIKDWDLCNASPLTVKGEGITVTAYKITASRNGSYNNELLFNFSPYACFKIQAGGHKEMSSILTDQLV